MSTLSARYDVYRWCIAVVLIAVSCVSPSTTLGQVPYVRIAKTGDPVPGMPDTVFGLIGMPVIDAEGNVALRNRMAGPGMHSLNDDAIFYGRPGNLGMIVRESDPFPEFGEGVHLRSLGQPLMAQSGQVGYTARLAGGGLGAVGDATFWAGPPDAVDLVARGGETPPDVTDGTVYGLSFGAAMSRSGQVAFSAQLVQPGQTDPPQETGLWSGTADDPRLVVRSGDPAPGTEPGVTFPTSGVLAPTWTVNARGALAFPAFLEGPGIDGTNNAGIWAGTHADLGLVMRAGDPAPLPAPGASFIGRPEYAIINGNDRVLFPAFVTGKGIDGSNNYGLWAGNTGGELELLAREGDEVPLLGADYTITGVFPFIQTEDDRVAMVASFNGPGVTPDNNQAMLFGGPGEWDLLFRESDQAPGLADGVVLDFDIHTPTIAIVESGAAGMLLGLSGEGVSETSDEALFWRRSESEPWQFVAREGELFDGSIVRDGGLFIRPGGGGAGGMPSINDQGDLAFWIQFEGDFPNEVTGAYIVPEPVSAALLAFYLANACFRRKRLNVQPS